MRTVKYGDGGHVVDMYTDVRGRMSFVMKRSAVGSVRRQSRFVPSHLIPLSMLELDYDIHGQGRLPRPYSVRLYNVYGTMQSNPVKSAVAMFMAEFLVNALREESPNPLLYEYLESSLRWLDVCTQGYANFHLVFLMRMTRFLGIYPGLDKRTEERAGDGGGYYYDLMDCEYNAVLPKHPHYLHPDEAHTIPYLLYMNYDNMHLFKFSRGQRRRCLEVINDYYRLHLPGFGELKSLDVFRELFD